MVSKVNPARFPWYLIILHCSSGRTVRPQFIWIRIWGIPKHHKLLAMHPIESPRSIFVVLYPQIFSLLDWEKTCYSTISWKKYPITTPITMKKHYLLTPLSHEEYPRTDNVEIPHSLSFSRSWQRSQCAPPFSLVDRDSLIILDDEIIAHRSPKIR